VTGGALLSFAELDTEFPRIEANDADMGYAYAMPSNHERDVVNLRGVDDYYRTSVPLSPTAARALAAQLLKAARWAEGLRGGGDDE
jgi:hypothetical protein